MQMTTQNFNAKKGKKEILIIKDAPHAGAYLKNTVVYEKTVKKFLSEM